MLQSGERSSDYHWHYGEEEILVVLEGSVTVRTPDGDRLLGPWDTVWFPTGERGAHGVRNDGAGPARFVMFSTLSDPEVTVYPDRGKAAVFAGWSRADVPERRGWIEPA
ncbi:MAG: cupin domain-containing protein [Actinomycetota bacterium]